MRNAKMLGRLLAVLTAVLLAVPAVAAAGQLKAGVAVEDASWHVGASAGQYASGDELDANDAGGVFASVHNEDPHQHSTRRKASYGMQSRLSARAIVVEGADGQKFALVKNDLYIPQDLLWRRTAQILEGMGIGIDRDNLTMASSHNHSTPMYSSTGWGVWVFQDVFDFRFFEYMAKTMARAVKRAHDSRVPVKVGGSVSQYGFVQRNVPGPSRGDDDSPAGFPNEYTDHDMIVVRFDRLSDGKPLANIVNYAVHPEDLEGNDLISADYLGPMERMADRATGATTIYTQGAVGSTEPEDNRWHNIHERAYFSHAQYAQSEFKARGMAGAIVNTFKDIAANTPEEPSRFVPFRSDFGDADVQFRDRWFAGPASHQYPGISSCRTDHALSGDPRFPVVGFPDCQTFNDTPAGDLVQIPTQDTGITTDTIQQFGIPVPENYSAPSYTGLEEDVSVHFQTLRIGDILFTICSCEQWADQSRNIKTRTDRKAGNQWNGWDWTPDCVPAGGGNWRCPPNMDRVISDAVKQKVHAQVTNDAKGWDDLSYVAQAESEPTNPAEIKGNYTHDDTLGHPDAGANANLGYGLTVAMGMGNDFNGYIATYREYQRGDHYRKALTAWGPHASDYMATRLVKMARGMQPGQGDPFPVVPGNLNVVSGLTPGELPGSEAKTTADLNHNERRAATIGEFAANGMAAYEASLPDDRAAKIVRHPDDVERFGAASFTWVGGSNFTDNPVVRVQRFTDGKWTDWADQSGEVPITIKFPPSNDRPAYRVQGSEFQWTAHFEAFVSRYDLMDRPLATPPGSYRFLVRGKRKQGSGPVDYSLTSREFLVKPWTGVTIEGLSADGGQPAFKVGPRRSIDCKPGGNVTIPARLGPIDYPDTWQSGHPSKPAFIKGDRRCYRDPAAPNDPEKLEWYCRPQANDPNGCSFRPWLDVGDLDRVVFTIVSANGKVDRVRGVKVGGEWQAERKLKSGEGAYIEAGDACDAHGNYNGTPSGTVGNKNAVPDRPPAGFSCVPKPAPGEVPGEGGGGSGGGGSGSGPGGISGSNPLGLPSSKKTCLDRRRFSFKIHQPPRRRIVSVNVYVNGKRKLSRKGSKITRVTIKKLPATKKTYVVRIVALTNRGDRVISQRRYRGCKKGRPSTRVEPRKGR
ncbi:MAG TPA: neutral/alkaline non-lysosomal ceramidase N-terminal domain-containing protein [Thermoleophilaceae bacterium]